MTGRTSFDGRGLCHMLYMSNRGSPMLKANGSTVAMHMIRMNEMSIVVVLARSREREMAQKR